MKHFLWVLLIAALVCSVAGCSRAHRIANDVNWIVLDGEPSRDN